MPSSFDALSKSLATGTSRRSLLRGLAGSLGALAVTSHAADARGRTVEICHRTWAWSTDWRIITVNANDQRKINAHLEHGDVINPDYSSDPTHCGGCGNTCEAPANATAYCTSSSCGFDCNAGYEWDGSACVEPVPPPPGSCWYLNCQVAAPDCIYVPAGTDYDYCASRDSCFPGNTGGLGGCFKWTVNQNDDFAGWP